MLDEQVVVHERQLDGVDDQLDLTVEAADVRVGDVGHLFEHELFDLGSRQLLEQEPAAHVDQHAVAGADLLAPEMLRDLDHTLLVGSADDHRPQAVVEQLLERDDLTGELGPAGQHHVQRLVEHDLGTPHQIVGREIGMHRHPHLAAAAEHVDGAVLVRAEQRAVRGRAAG